MKKQLLLFAMILLPLVASAHDIEVQNGDGVTIYYDYTNNGTELAVTARGFYMTPKSYTGNVVIPEEVTYMNKVRKVTSIVNGAFYQCTGLTSVTIPNSVKRIGNDTFWGCSGLNKVIVSDIAAWCGINFGNTYANPLYFAKHLYSDENTEIKDLVIPNSVTTIGTLAFYQCTGLSSVTIGSGVTNIGSSAFKGCSGLRKVIVKDIAAWCGVEFGDPDANPFLCAKHLYSDENTEIKDLVIPNSVTTIGSRTFYNCTGLTSVIIGNSVTSIDKSAFYQCYGLTSVTIGNSVTSIGDWAFYQCLGLTTITIGNSVTSIGESAFQNCSALTSITIPSSVTSIGYEAFEGCSGLTSVTIPNSVTIIGYGAFKDCSGLTSVTIGSGVTNIGDRAFGGADIPTVISLIENPLWIYGKSSDYSPFTLNTFNNATLYVPKGTIDKYKATSGWKDFIFIEESDTPPTPPTTEKCEKPTISYENGKLTFTCETEGAICQSTITDPDITSYSGNEVQLGVTYTISVYAAKSGYENSETATATLCWIDQQPKTEGITNGIANIPANAVLIQSEGGSIKVQGVDEGTQVNVYGINGTQAGSVISQSGATTINTNLQPGSIAIVKIGQKSVKVVIK